MNKCFIFLIFPFFCFSQIQLWDNDTIKTDFYDVNKNIIKGFTYKKQFITKNTGEKMLVLFDSICENNSKKNRIIYGETTFDKYYFYRDSLIIRNWNLRNSTLEHKKHFFLSIYLKSKKYKNLKISIYYNLKDSLIGRVVVAKPDSLNFYTKDYLSDIRFDETKLKSPFICNVLDNSFLNVYFNKNNFIEQLYYDINKEQILHITFQKFYIPKEYGFRKSTNNERIGVWYTYYQNGKVSSEGEYSGSEFDSNGNEINIKKTGKWIYYTEQGCIEKEEVWSNGVLISPIPIIKRTKTKRNKKATH
jgi:hypothetical protein